MQPCTVSAVQAVKHHPASVDLELVKRLTATTQASNLQKFLATEFTSISRDLAGAVLCLSVNIKKATAGAKDTISSHMYL